MLWGTLEGKDMQVVHEVSAASEPMSDAEREKVREQLERLLQTHHFRNSRRYPALLRFVVEETLEGRGEFLKERLLGVRVFDRPADYDTASDPIVRVTIAEIRKRIAQYYHDEEHDAEMRIELLPGRYAPEFRARNGKRQRTEEEVSQTAISPELRVGTIAATETALEPVVVPETKAERSRAVMLGWFAGSGLLAVLLVFGGFFLVRWMRPSALEELWSPVLAAPGEALFCVPTDVGKKRGPATDGNVVEPAPQVETNPRRPGEKQTTFLDYESLGQNVVYSDMLATLKIAKVLTNHQRDYRVRLNTATTLEDLKQGPTILIGGLDNQWTMRSLNPLRFHFEGSDETRYWIIDSKDRGNREWSLDLKQIFGAVNRDYAIIARLHNDQTGKPEMIVAGIGMSGTAAAGEFLGDPERVAELRRRIGPGFKDHDFEAVLSTDVVNGSAGSPKILAVTSW